MVRSTTNGFFQYARTQLPIVGVASTLVLLGLVGTASFVDTQRMAETTSEVDETHNILARLSNVSLGVERIVSIARIFVLTGEESFVAPLEQVDREISDDFLVLREMFASQPDQLARLALLEELVERRLAASNEYVALRRLAGLQQTVDEIPFGGEQLAIDIRTQIAEMKQVEEVLLEQRRTNAAASHARTVTAMIFGGLVSFIVVLLAFSALRKQVASRKEAERQLRMTAGYLTAAQRIASVGSWEWHISTNVLWWSDEMYRILGIDPQICEANYEVFLERVHPEDQKLVNDAVKGALKKHGPYSIDHRIVALDGTEKVVHEQVEVAFDEEGRAIRMTGAVHDITVRKRAETRLANFLEGAPDATLIVDSHGKIAYVNSQAERLFGYSKATMLGRQIESLIPEGSRSSNSSLFAGSFEAPVFRSTGADIEITALHKDGSVIPVEISLSPLESEGEKLVACSVRDITERAAMEEALQQSEAQYRTIVDSAHEGIMLVDSDATISFANNRMAEMLGYEAEEMLGRTILELTHEEEGVITRKQKQISEGMTEHCDCRYVHKDGSDVWVITATTPLMDEDGKFVGSLLMVSDNTEQRKLMAQLRQSQKMEVVGQLTGGVAHDFNNLLMVMLGNLQLLKGSLQQDESLHPLVQAALDAGSRGAELTKRLLAFSRKQILAPEVININQLVMDVKSLLKRTLGEEITLMIKQGDELWSTEIDPSQLESSLVNLAVNARDAMPAGGTLTVETINTTLDEAHVGSQTEIPAGEYVLVRVCDTGTGMPKEVLENVFEPFFTTKEFGEGSGLGLSMVHGFVSQSNGYIDIESDVGHGTTFDLYLPRSRAATEAARASTQSKGVPSGQEAILVVEDQAAVRRITTRLLESLGYRVLEADSGAEALTRLDEYEDIDLLFTDMVMPGGMSGAELVDEARQRRPDMKVLYTSGYTESTVLEKSASRSTEFLLNKPDRREELAQAIRDTLDAA